MNIVLQAVRLLEVILLVGYISCQDGFSERDILRLQQLSSNDDQIEAITSYSTNVIHRDPIRNEHSISTRQLDHNTEQQTDNFSSQDSETGASNQYAAMQYSLPPEEFLQQIRAENQYISQYSTPAPQVSYTVTPQSQYQYNVVPQSGYEGTQPTNQLSQVDQSKVNPPQPYKSNGNSIQYYGSPNAYSSETIQSTPSPISSYLSTSLPNTQYVGTPANSQSYVSSASPVFLSSSSNIPQYVSSPAAIFQTASTDYGNRVTTATNTINYDNNEYNKKIQIDHYDNSANGIRYPINVQYQHEVSSTTQAPPSSTAYPDPLRDAWQNAMNAGVNSLSKSLHEVSMLTQYQNALQNNNNQQESRHESNSENINSDTHRMGNNVASANNMYMNFVQPDYQVYNNIKSRTRDLEHESAQPQIYSHGDYGWNLSDKKSLIGGDNHGEGSYAAYRSQTADLQSDNTNSNYQTEQQRPQSSYGYNPHRMTSDYITHGSKISEAQEFAKAAAKAHENMKQSSRINENYYMNNYAPNLSTSTNNMQPQSSIVSTFYGNSDKHKTKYISETPNANQYVYGNSPTDLITASPFYYSQYRDNNFDIKTKQPFDHAKALKNIVPIDVSNVVPNSEAALKAVTNFNNNRYNFQSYPKEQIEQSLKQAYRPLTDAYYKDKNTGYGFNIKSKPDDILASSDGIKQFENNILQYNKYHNQDQAFNQALIADPKRYGESPSHQYNYLPQATNVHNENQPPPNNIQQAIQRPIEQQTDIASFLKLNDIPYRLTQGLSSDSLKLHNSNFDQGSIPQPIPGRLNQNVASHQLDVSNSILSKLLNKQANFNYNRPSDIDPQTGSALSTIHGFRVANPFNVDLKIVSEMLKGKPMVDDTHMITLRDQFNKPLPLKLDMSSLQQLLLKNDNYGNLGPLTDGISAIGNSYNDPYSIGRYPYQGGVKYSRSQEEEENLPIAESSNTHPIGAVMEQDDSPNIREADDGTDLTAQGEEEETKLNFDKNHPKIIYNNRQHRFSKNQRHPNSLISGRHPYQRKYPRHNVGEPYPLLKPPPPHLSRNKSVHNKGDRHGRRRRIPRPKMARALKTEPLFEAESSGIESDAQSSVPILLKPPAPVAEDKSDVIDDKNNS